MSVATIRNYVNPALEYAYDWNTPGGVPGSSEIGAGMDVARLVSQIMGTGESTAEAPAPAVDPATGRGDPAQPTGSGAGGRARVADPSANLTEIVLHRSSRCDAMARQNLLSR